MSSYRGTADRSDRAKAITAVVLVHAVLAAIILTGLNVRQFRQTFESMTTIDIREAPIPPPPPPPPKPASTPQPAKKAAGPPAPKAEPTPVVAPPPKIPTPTPVPAAKVAGTGTAPASGASTAGTGTGAGGAGNGPGGGGPADYSRFTPARMVTKIPDYEYQRLSSTGLRSGRVGIRILVNPDGSVSNCRIAQSSSDATIDALMCELTLRYIRFTPARDPTGRPVPYEVTFSPDWHP
jgi:protein TonB